MFFDKKLAICLDFQISDPIRNPDYFHPNLFSTILIPD